jgi:hypothetical protein
VLTMLPLHAPRRQHTSFSSPTQGFVGLPRLTCIAACLETRSGWPSARRISTARWCTSSGRRLCESALNSPQSSRVNTFEKARPAGVPSISRRWCPSGKQRSFLLFLICSRSSALHRHHPRHQPPLDLAQTSSFSSDLPHPRHVACFCFLVLDCPYRTLDFAWRPVQCHQATCQSTTAPTRLINMRLIPILRSHLTPVPSNLLRTQLPCTDRLRTLHINHRLATTDLHRRLRRKLSHHIQHKRLTRDNRL